MREHHQKLPAAGPEREALRQKGQFWTPAWVAEAMVAYVVGGGASTVFDPAVGVGAFLRATKSISEAIDRNLEFRGTEIDPDVLEQAKGAGLGPRALAGVQIRDFVRDPPCTALAAIAGNPPYIRHHRLSRELKRELRGLAVNLIGAPLDGRAGLHVYFLLRALRLLAADGRLAFVMPADTCEGVFAPVLWQWITREYRLEVVVTFVPEASPFPGVDTNPVILMIRRAKPQDSFLWVRCDKGDSWELRDWLLRGCQEPPGPSVSVQRRAISEGLATGLSRAPSEVGETGAVLGDFASVMRGIATGANDFFLLRRSEAEALQIPDEFLVPAIGRTRDVPGDRADTATIAALEKAGRPTLLFCPDGRPLERFPPSVRAYLQEGERLGLPQRALISTRRPWYKMERRAVPPILFAYLGRRNARFIRNLAGVVPSTGFLCVYPRQEDPEFLRQLWEVLSQPQTVANLALVGKSYGSGAIKVEPRALERLPLPPCALDEVGLSAPPKSKQMQLIDGD